MFLLTYRMHHEVTWRAWFRAAAGLKLKTPPPRRPDVPVSDVVGKLHPPIPKHEPAYQVPARGEG